MTPVNAPAGTRKLICRSLKTVKFVTGNPPIETAEAPVKFTPEIVVSVPTGPLGGKTVESCGAAVGDFS